MKTKKPGYRNYNFTALCVIVAVVVFCSCSTLYYTKYSNTDICIGASKTAIIERYGQPYAEELFKQEGKVIEILCYKELMAYGYMLKTYFHFEDNILVKKTQEDCPPSKVVLKESSK